jgi:hypothetical protein
VPENGVVWIGGVTQHAQHLASSPGRLQGGCKRPATQQPLSSSSRLAGICLYVWQLCLHPCLLPAAGESRCCCTTRHPRQHHASRQHDASSCPVTAHQEML